MKETRDCPSCGQRSLNAFDDRDVDDIDAAIQEELLGSAPWWICSCGYGERQAATWP